MTLKNHTLVLSDLPCTTWHVSDTQSWRGFAWSPVSLQVAYVDQLLYMLLQAYRGQVDKKEQALEAARQARQEIQLKLSRTQQVVEVSH